MSAMYYLSRGAAPEGPFEEARLVQMIQSGELTQGGACPVGQTQWQALSAFPVFAQALAARAAGAAVPQGYSAQAPGAPYAPQAGYGVQPAGYGAQPPGPTAPGYGAQPPGPTAPGYGAQAPGPNAPGYGAQAPGPTAPGYGAQAPGYGAQPNAPGYGAQPPGPTIPGDASAPYGGAPTAAAAPPKKSRRGLLIALLVGILLLAGVGAAVGVYFVFFSSGGAPAIAASVPKDCELLLEVPSVRRLVLDLHDVQYLDTSLRDDKKVFDDSANSLAQAFDISPSDATSLLVATETFGISARKLEATPEGVLAVGLRDDDPVEVLLKSSRFTAAGAVGQHGRRYLLTKKVLPPSAKQDAVLKTLASAELSATDKEVLVWFSAQKVLAVGSLPLVTDLAQVLENGAASIEQNPAYQAAKKDFETGSRSNAFLDPGALSNVSDPKVKALIASYFTPAGPLTGSFNVKPAGFVTSMVGHVTGSKLPRMSAYEPPQPLNLADRLPSETFAYLALTTQSKLSGAETEQLLLDQLGSLDAHSRAETEHGLRQLEQLLGVSAAKLLDGVGGQAVLGVAASTDTAIDQLSSGPAAASHFNLTWVQELKDDSEYKKLAAQLKSKLLPGLREVTVSDAGTGFDIAPRGTPLPISLRLRFLDKYLFVTAGSNALDDRALAAFSKGEHTLKDDAAHQASLSALPSTQHFRLWLDTGRIVDTLLKNPLLKARFAEQGLALDKITLSGPNRVVSALSIRSEVQTEIWTYRMDALNFQALAPLGVGAAALAGGLPGLPAF